MELIFSSKRKAIPPFRVGRKQSRVILDSVGLEVAIFRTGSENIAQLFCNFLNDNYKDIIDANTKNKI